MTSLKQIKPLERIVFLKKFTQELLINSIEEEEILKRIEAEKLRHKLIQPHLTPEQAFRKIIKTPTKEKIIPSKRYPEPPRLKKTIAKTIATQKIPST
jgi:regulator of replication initiation timing